MPVDHIFKPRDAYDAVRRYGLAIVAAIIALLLREILFPFLGPNNPYHTVWAAVVFSAWYCGLAASIVTTLLSVVGVWVFLPSTLQFFRSSRPQDCHFRDGGVPGLFRFDYRPR